MQLWLFPLTFIISAGFTALTLKLIIPLLHQAGLTGKDLHKKGRPPVAEMGGLGLVVGISAGLVLSVGASAFLHLPLNTPILLGVLSTTLVVCIIGIFDDLLDIRQLVKALSPLLAAFPLMAVRAGRAVMNIPPFGRVNFGLVYSLLLIPLGVTGAANAWNMLAGFNGMEAGVGVVAVLSLTVVAALADSAEALLILLTTLGALLAILYFNWYPSKVLIGDVGTLTIGAIVASSVIVGNIETAGGIIIIPHLVDFLYKAFHGFPSRGWAGELDPEDGKLHCPQGGPVSLPQLIMKATGGINELHLTLTVMGVEAIFGGLAIAIYLV